MTITPARGLSAGERVRVAVRGFPPWGKVFLSECARATDVSPLGCGQQLSAQPFLLSDGRGAASGSFTVQAAAATGPLHAPRAKCAAGPGCVLVATIGIPVGVPKVVATAPLRFTPPPTQPAPVAAYVQGFYRSYAAARKLGPRAAQAVVRSHVAAWYFPILTAPNMAGGDPVECGLRGPVSAWSFTRAGVWGGQAVIVIGSQPLGAPQKLWIVVTTVPATGKITGITCSAGGAKVTSTGARDAVTSWYPYYITARREGVSPQDAIARLTQGGPAAADPYLQQVRYAIARQHLGYDPVTCARAGVPGVSPRTARVVAGSSAGVVVVSGDRYQFLVTVLLGAKGWMVGGIACLR